MPSEDPRAEPQIFSTPGDPESRPAPPPGRRRELVSLSALLSARLLRLRPRRGPRITGQIERDGLEIPRWGILLGILLTFLLFIAMLALLSGLDEAHAATDSGINFDRPSKDWYGGPVRYIISKQEVKAYKALETELDRQNFIDWFWQRRDVVPATPQNEFRDRFEQRVFDANRLFSDTAKPGWKTDQGKVYILVGPPDEINRDVMAKTHRGIITWVYRRPPFPDLQPNTVVAFARDHSGEFVLSESPTLDSDVARGLQFAKVKRTAEDRLILPGRADPALLAAGVPVSQGTLATMLIGGRLQQLPPHEERMFKDFVYTREFFGTIPAESRFDFYRAGDGSTYTTLTIGIRSTAVQYSSDRRGGRERPDVAVFGKLINKDRPDEVYALAGDSAFTESTGNAAAGPEDLLIFQARGGFKPGKYQLVLGVQDKVAKKVSAYRRDVDIPDLTGEGLRLSSITLAGEMEPTDYAPVSAKPFYLGKFRVEPRPDNGFRKSDELNVYFQIYDPAADPATGRPRLDVYYSFKQRAADGSLTDVGTYGVKDAGAQVQGYAVPLEQWPAGEYLITVQVVDKVSGVTASAEASFVIRED